MKITAGTTSYILDIFVQDSSSTAGAGLAGLVYNTASLTAKYKRQGSATWTTISLATATAGTWASGGFIAAGSADDGDYELHLPNAVIASGVAWVAVSLQGAANMAPTKIRLGLTATNDQSAADGGITKIATIETSTTTTIPALIPTAGAIADQVWDEATAGHTTSGTYGGRVVRSTNSNVEVQITGSNHIAADVHEFQTGVITAAALAADAITAAALAADAVTEIQSGLALETSVQSTLDRLGFTLAALAGNCADPQTAAETYSIILGANTFTIDHTGLDATGTRTTATLTKS
jgi:hypothetical protein